MMGKTLEKLDLKKIIYLFDHIAPKCNKNIMINSQILQVDRMTRIENVDVRLAACRSN